MNYMCWGEKVQFITSGHPFFKLITNVNFTFTVLIMLTVFCVGQENIVLLYRRLHVHKGIPRIW